MTEDQFVHWDGAYLLGALSPVERDAFEEHMVTCAACRARVDEIADVPALLTELSAADFQAEPEPLPDTLLPRLLRAADVKRRRSRVLISGLAAVAAACVAALVLVLVWPGSSSQSNRSTVSTAQWRPMQAAFSNVPLTASVRLVPTDFGTEVDVRCKYLEGATSQSPSYTLVVYNKAHAEQHIGWWTLTGGKQEMFPSPSSWQRSQISEVTIELADGTRVLTLSV